MLVHNGALNTIDDHHPSTISLIGRNRKRQDGTCDHGQRLTCSRVHFGTQGSERTHRPAIGRARRVYMAAAPKVRAALPCSPTSIFTMLPPLEKGVLKPEGEGADMFLHFRLLLLSSLPTLLSPLISRRQYNSCHTRKYNASMATVTPAQDSIIEKAIKAFTPTQKAVIEMAIDINCVCVRPSQHCCRPLTTTADRHRGRRPCARCDRSHY